MTTETSGALRVPCSTTQARLYALQATTPALREDEAWR